MFEFDRNIRRHKRFIKCWKWDPHSCIRFNGVTRLLKVFFPRLSIQCFGVDWLASRLKNLLRIIESWAVRRSLTKNPSVVPASTGEVNITACSVSVWRTGDNLTHSVWPQVNPEHSMAWYLVTPALGCLSAGGYYQTGEICKNTVDLHVKCFIFLFCYEFMQDLWFIWTKISLLFLNGFHVNEQ